MGDLATSATAQNLLPIKYVNMSSSMPLADSNLKLNDHLQRMNAQDWELMSVFVEAHGIEERLFMFWRKAANATP